MDETSFVQRLIKKPEKFYLRLAIFFGFLTVFLIPPIQGVDENKHFFRIYQISEGGFIGTKFNEKESGGVLPISLYNLRDVVDYLSAWSPSRKVTSAQLFSAFDLPLEPENRTNLSFPSAIVYPPVSYFAPALVVASLRIIETPPIYFVYGARLINFLLAVLIIYFAIRITPILKWVFVLTALSPMSVFLTSSMCQDAFVLPLCLFFTAYIFNLAYSRAENSQPVEKISNNKLLILLFLGILIALSKFAYLPLLLAYFLIPKDRFDSKGKYYGFAGILLAGAVLFQGLWFYLIKDIQVPIVPDEQQNLENLNRPNAKEQLWFILSNPLFFAKLIYHQYKNIFWQFKEMIAPPWSFSVSPLLMELFFYGFGSCLILSGLFSYIGRSGLEFVSKISFAQRVLSMMVVFCCLFLIAFFMYLGGNGVGATEIWGIQPRYYLLILPLFCFTFSLKKNVPENFERLILISSLSFIFLGLMLLQFALYSRWDLGLKL